MRRSVLSTLILVLLLGGAGEAWGQNGSIVAWGYNSTAQCEVPAPNTDFVAIAAGERHSLGLKADGSIAAWGYNYYGQCEVPAPNTGFAAIAAGSFHSLGLKDVTPLVPGDLDGDGDVDLNDLAELLGRYGSCDGDPTYDVSADFDASGCIDLSDLAYLLGYYGTGA